MTKYANAEKVLPNYVLRLIREHFPSGLLWISPDGSPSKTEKEIIRLLKQGLGASEIALKVHRSRRRVNQILKAYWEKPEKGTESEDGVDDFQYTFAEISIEELIGKMEDNYGTEKI